MPFLKGCYPESCYALEFHVIRRGSGITQINRCFSGTKHSCCFIPSRRNCQNIGLELFPVILVAWVTVNSNCPEQKRQPRRRCPRVFYNNFFLKFRPQQVFKALRLKTNFFGIINKCNETVIKWY